jgi:ribonucleoside-triphosphate reductase
VKPGGRLATKALLKAIDDGIGKGVTSLFPIVIFKLKEGVTYSPQDPNYDLRLYSERVTAKRMFPNYSNLDAPYNLKYYKEGHPETEVAYMGCRTRAISNVNGPEIVTDRGNLSFTTLNLPRYAIEASREGTSEEERIEIFFKKLDKYLDIARRQLEHRYKIQCNRKVYNLPYVMKQGAYMGSEHLSPDDTIRKAIENGTLSFGFVGLAEALVALTGHDHTEGEQYQQLGLRIVKHMRDYADKLTEEQHMNWSLIATPAESVAGKMLRKDRAEFGVIPGVTDKEYYTNSNHVPVWRKIRASEKIRLEAPYHELTNAGCYMARFKQGERKSKRCAA